MRRPPDLPALLKEASLVVCVGPGGVGKTTISAVLALHQAAAGRDALVLTIDPARRLADALSVSGLTNDPAPVRAFCKMHPAGTLSALMLDPSATFDHMLAVLVADPQRRAELMANRFYRFISRSLAGTLEYMAVERLHELKRGGRFDSIILDTPPTTNALDFLDAPDRLATFFSDKITRWFMPAARQADPGWKGRLFNRAGSSVLSLLNRVAGDNFVEETVGFFSIFADLLGTFQARGEEIGKMLRDPSALFLVVCSPDPNRVAEAHAIDENLARAGCPARGFIINRVDQGFLPADEEMEQGLARITALLGGAGERTRVKVFMERLEAMRQEHASASATQQKVVEAFRQHAGKRPVFTAPAVPVGQSPRAALLAIYVGLFAPSAAPVALELAAGEAAAEGAADGWAPRRAGEILPNLSGGEVN